MNKRIIQIISIAGLVFSFGSSANIYADRASHGNVYGKIFADWYYDATNDSKIIQKSQFELTRVYLGYKFNINEHFSTDALLDIQRVEPVTKGTADFDSEKKTVGLDLNTDHRYFAYLKTAYISWKGILPSTTLSFGQIPFFAFNVQESFWGHRYVYPVFMDKNGYASSADLGASLKVNPIDIITITAGVVNGEGYKAPQDPFGNYKTALGLKVNPVKDITLYAYYDWMPVGKTTDSAQTTIAAFAGYNFQNIFSIGIEYDGQMQQKGNKDHDVSGISIYGKVSPIKQLAFFGRFDMASSKHDWKTPKDKIQDGQTVVAGLEYSPVSKVKLALDYQRFTPKLESVTAIDKIYINGQFTY